MTDPDPTTSTPSETAWTCCPEWCELAAEPHDEECPEHKLDITKGFFVGSHGTAAANAIQAYKIWLDKGCTEEDAIDVARSEAEEAAACFAGIGSCGRGWCQHS